TTSRICSGPYLSSSARSVGCTRAQNAHSKSRKATRVTGAAACPQVGSRTPTGTASELETADPFAPASADDALAAAAGLCAAGLCVDGLHASASTSAPAPALLTLRPAMGARFPKAKAIEDTRVWDVMG